MQKRLVTIALGVLCLPALAIAAYGVAHSVSDTPSPQVVIPASSTSPAGGGEDPSNRHANAGRPGDDRGMHRATSTSGPGHGADDGTQRSTTPNSSSTTLGGSNDAPGHDAVISPGGAAAPGGGNDGIGYEVGGSPSSTVTTSGTPVTTTTSGQSVSGSGASGSPSVSGSSGSSRSSSGGRVGRPANGSGHG